MVCENLRLELKEFIISLSSLDSNQTEYKIWITCNFSDLVDFKTIFLGKFYFKNLTKLSLPTVSTSPIVFRKKKNYQFHSPPPTNFQSRD